MLFCLTTNIHLIPVNLTHPTTNLPVIIHLTIVVDVEIIRYKFSYYPNNSDYSSWRSCIIPHNFQNTRYSLSHCIATVTIVVTTTYFVF